MTEVIQNKCAKNQHNDHRKTLRRAEGEIGWREAGANLRGLIAEDKKFAKDIKSKLT